MTEQGSDLVSLWKRSETPNARPDNASLSRSKLSERLSGERSTLWTNLSQMAPGDQVLVMNKLTSLWPYNTERRALNWPIHAGILTNCLTSSFIVARINADMTAFNSRLSYLESVRQCPKAPFVFGIYSSGLTYYVMTQMLIVPAIYRETKPCSSCILTQTVGISLFTGVIMPLLSTPYLCYYVLLQRQGEKFPNITNTQEFMMLAWEGSRAARSLLSRLIPLQTAVAAISTYAMLWGRERMFDTMDADPEMARDLLLEAQGKPTMKQRVTDFLRKLPFINDVLGDEAPEKERVL